MILARLTTGDINFHTAFERLQRQGKEKLDGFNEEILEFDKVLKEILPQIFITMTLYEVASLLHC